MHALLNEYLEIVNDRTLTVEDYYSRQKDILKKGLAELKNLQHPDVDYVVGMISLYEGDKYGIPVKNALGHLNRSYKNGNPDAGLLLSAVFSGVIQTVSQDIKDETKALNILNEIAATGNPKAYYDISRFYFDKIILTVDGGGYAPMEWFDLVEKNVALSAEAGFIGGYTLLGYLYADGFGTKIEPDINQAIAYYEKAISVHTGPETNTFLGDAKHALGCYYYDGIGFARDRKKGLTLIQEAADLGNVYAESWLRDNYNLLVKEGMIGDHDDIVYEESFEDLSFETATQDQKSNLQNTQIKDTRTRH